MQTHTAWACSHSPCAHACTLVLMPAQPFLGSPVGWWEAGHQGAEQGSLRCRRPRRSPPPGLRDAPADLPTRVRRRVVGAEPAGSGQHLPAFPEHLAAMTRGGGRIPQGRWSLAREAAAWAWPAGSMGTAADGEGETRLRGASLCVPDFPCLLMGHEGVVASRPALRCLRSKEK